MNLLNCLNGFNLFNWSVAGPPGATQRSDPNKSGPIKQVNQLKQIKTIIHCLIGLRRPDTNQFNKLNKVNK